MVQVLKIDATFDFDVLRRGVSVESAIAANLLSLSVRGGRRVNMFIRLCINRRHLPTIFDLCVLLMLQPRSV
ncbi:unnamed protein product (mitochondrion) [Plasmodiophora brassicae]|uniref:Uncharacterized protein n=1 Tax=Plasmodiophora brassicae TaxID=37360 RepID=A0A3P3YIJ8_PLABS|nr:unnamed protein product [Plasmodiophora brassicae]